MSSLGKMLNRWKAQYEKCPAEDTGMLAFWTELGLKISREVREVLKTDVDLRLKAHELRKLDMMEAETDEVERMLSRYVRRRGLGDVRGDREMLRTEALEMLVEAGQPVESAQLLVDRLIPPLDHQHEERVSLYQSYRMIEERLAEDIERGTEDLRAQLGDIDIPEEMLRTIDPKGEHGILTTDDPDVALPEDEDMDDDGPADDLEDELADVDGDL